jgi:hypothetical protein
MNLERAIKLREQLLNLPGKFAYEEFGKALTDRGFEYDFETVKKHLCNTSACVAGWCVLLNPEITETNLSYADSAAQKYLELDYASMRLLFFPDRNYTLDDAIERLDHLINLEKAKST